MAENDRVSYGAFHGRYSRRWRGSRNARCPSRRRPDRRGTAFRWERCRCIRSTDRTARRRRRNRPVPDRRRYPGRALWNAKRIGTETKKKPIRTTKKNMFRWALNSPEATMARANIAPNSFISLCVGKKPAIDRGVKISGDWSPTDRWLVVGEWRWGDERSPERTLDIWTVAADRHVVYTRRETEERDDSMWPKSAGDHQTKGLSPLAQHPSRPPSSLSRWRTANGRRAERASPNPLPTGPGAGFFISNPLPYSLSFGSGTSNSRQIRASVIIGVFWPTDCCCYPFNSIKNECVFTDFSLREILVDVAGSFLFYFC